MEKSFTAEFLKEYDEAVLPEEISRRFAIEKCLGSNAFGETFLCSENETGSLYVLKKGTSADSALCNEAELLSGLTHEGLPQFEHVESDSDGVLILRKFIDGEPLSTFLGKTKTADITEIISVMSKLCDILSYLHTQAPPIIHRDIKPSNIIYNPDTKAVSLIDFGISRKYSENSEADTAYFGTHKFAPPEQYGFAQTDCRTDIYALGVVLRFWLTGSTDKSAVIEDKRLAKIVDKCTALAPEQRYQTAEAVKKALNRYSNKTRNTAMKALAAVLAVCVVGASAFYVYNNTDLFGQPVLAADAEAVTFTEPLVEATVRLILGKEDGETVTNDELGNITELWFSGTQPIATVDVWGNTYLPNKRSYDPIYRLDDFAKFPNLRYLTLIGQPASDLSPLALCQSLNRLQFYRSPITDTSSLSSMPWLASVVFSECVVSDFSFLKDLGPLYDFAVENMPLTSITEFRDAKLVGHLCVGGTPLTSLDGIEYHTSLVSLDIARTQITDFSPLNDMPSIQKLFISSDMKQYLDTMTRDDIEIIFG